MIFNNEIVTVPFELWLGATVLLVSGIYLNWMLYKITLQSSTRDTLSAILASKALSHIISIASLTTIFRKSMPWHRTNKFATSSKLLRALSTTKTELILGISILALATIGFILMPLPGLVLMFLIGLSYRGFNYLSAPVVAIFAEMSNKNAATD